MFEKLVIHGGTPLSGTLKIGGSKNSALPILCAATLISDENTIQNCPDISDVQNTLQIIEHLGGNCSFSNNIAKIDCKGLSGTEIPAQYMDKLRSSVLFMGALLARFGKATLSYPGGCAIGKRAIDFHLDAFRRLGAKVEESGGRITCTAENGLIGADIKLTFPSVGATENILLAATAAKGTTVIHGAAREPEVIDLIHFLNSSGMQISGEGTSRITIHGTDRLRGITHRVIPDRIVAATYICAITATRGKATLTHVNTDHFGPIIKVLKKAGVIIRPLSKSVLYINAQKPIAGFGKIKTAPHPKFPTDMAPCLMATSLLCTCGRAWPRGKTTFVETIFENRFMHVPQLLKTSAIIKTQRKKAAVTGVSQLSPAMMECTDLRGGAAAVVAALAAKGTSEITNLSHIYRGYEDIVRDIKMLGGNIGLV